MYFWLAERYRRTEYILSEAKIRVKTGTFFEENDVELLWSKVVQANFNQGGVQRILFGTGNIRLQAAGQADVEIRLKELADPDEAFTEVLSHLKEDVSLPDDSLQQTHRQSPSGIFLDVFFPTLLITSLAWGIVRGLQRFTQLPYPSLDLRAPAIVFCLCVLGGALFILVKINTSYRVYDYYVERVVTFFGRTRTVMPLSALSGLYLSSPLHKRILSLSYLKLSVPGMNETERWINLSGGERIRSELQSRSETVNGLDGSTGSASPDQLYVSGPGFASIMVAPLGLMVVCGAIATGIEVGLHRYLPLNLPAVIDALFISIPILIGGLFGLIRLAYFVGSTFMVEGNRVEFRFVFFNRSVTSLSTDKIKAIVKSQGPIGRLLNTYTLRFHSIGTEKNVESFHLKHCADNQRMLRHIWERKGCVEEAGGETTQPSYSFTGMVFQQPGYLSLSLLSLIPPVGYGASFSPGLLIPLAAAGLVLAAIVCCATHLFLRYYFDRFVWLNLHPQYLTFREGWIRTWQYFVLYSDVRDVEYAQEPVGSNGWFRVDFASVQNTAGSSFRSKGLENLVPQALTGQSFIFPHMASIDQTSRALENLFSGEITLEEFSRRAHRSAAEEEPTLLESHPHRLPYIGQGLSFGVAVSVGVLNLFLSLLALPLVLACVLGGSVLGALYGRTISYVIKQTQFEATYWLILTPTKSIKLNKINNIEIDRGFVDKILRTGTVKISTTGGSGVEFSANYLPEYQRFYENLREEYRE